MERSLFRLIYRKILFHPSLFRLFGKSLFGDDAPWAVMGSQAGRVFAFFQIGLKADPNLEILFLSKSFKWYIFQASRGAANTTHLPLPGKPQTPYAAAQ